MLVRKNSSKIVQHGLGRPVKAHVDDLLLVLERLQNEIPDECVICCACLDLPNDVVADGEAIDEGIETGNAGGYCIGR